MADKLGHLTGEELLQLLIDFHEECKEEKFKYWNTAMEAMCERLDADQIEAVRRTFTKVGEMIMIEAIFGILTSIEDVENIFGG